MNKVGIITFHRAVNYGAVLQAYALQTIISKMGINCEIIDYRNDFLEKLHNTYNIKKYKSLFHYIYSILKNRIKKDNRKNFELFRKNNLKISQKKVICITIFLYQEATKYGIEIVVILIIHIFWISLILKIQNVHMLLA